MGRSDSMSARVASIASSWSAVSRYGKRLLELEGPFRVGAERVSSSRGALRVEVQEVAREDTRRPAGPRLDRVPALRAERGELRRLPADADISRDLRQLLRRREDAVLAAVFELEVVAGDARRPSWSRSPRTGRCRGPGGRRGRRPPGRPSTRASREPSAPQSSAGGRAFATGSQRASAPERRIPRRCAPR